MTSAERRRTAERIRHLLDAEGDAVRANATHFNERRYDALREFDEYEALRERAREIKEDAIADLPTLVDRVTEAVEANGGHVHVAEDAAEANRYVAEVAAAHDAGTLVKSKSMTTEEIEVNDHLAERGVDVYETDLGEFVVQVADEAPSHIVGPAIHKSREEITRLFEARFDPGESLDSAEALTAFARDYLGERIREADLGMTGANFVLAESGTVVTVTNEGNARKCAVTPDVHVAVAGVEKLIPSIVELEPFVKLVARAATGQSIAQYVSLFTPPSASPTLDFDAPGEAITGDGDGGSAGGRDGGSADGGDGGSAGDDDREFHLVLLDNGRTAMREDDDLRETLYCIRCGACANSCANFQAVGGHAFGGETYSGGIATGWEAGVEGLETAAGFNDLCTGCSRCVNACPVKIDVPWINTVVRDRVNRGADPDAFAYLVDGLAPDEEPAGLDLQKRLFGNVGTLARLGSATAPVSNWLASAGPVRAAMERLFGVDRRRPLPEFRRETLRDWFAARGPRVASGDAAREAVLYPDLYTDHVLVERGKAAVRALEAAGVRVRVPDAPESGRAPLSQGMVATAERQAGRTRAALAEHVDAGRDVVVVEPSDLAMFRREYEKLLPADAFERLRGASYDLLEYFYGRLENGADPAALRRGDGERVAYHGHCQGRTLGLDAYAEAVLDELGYDVLTSDAECCGMAGSFGYKAEYFELSADVGEQLRAEFEAGDARDRTVLATGTSCTEQLDGLLDREIRHPVELIAPDG